MDIESTRIHAVIDDTHLVEGDLVDLMGLVAQMRGDHDDAVAVIRSFPLVVPDVARRPVEVLVAASPELGRMQREYVTAVHAVAAPGKRLRRHPVVGVQDVEYLSALPLDALEPVHEPPAHGVGFVDEIGGFTEGTEVVTDAVNHLVCAMPIPGTREEMHLMSLLGEVCRQRGDVGRHASDRHSPQAFPGKKTDSHDHPPAASGHRRPGDADVAPRVRILSPDQCRVMSVQLFRERRHD